MFPHYVYYAGLYLVVTMQAPKEVPPDLQCRDKFLIQSIVAPYGATMKEITSEMVGQSASSEYLMIVPCVSNDFEWVIVVQ